MKKYEAPSLIELGPIEQLTKGGVIPLLTDTLELLGSM